MKMSTNQRLHNLEKEVKGLHGKLDQILYLLTGNITQAATKQAIETNTFLDTKAVSVMLGVEVDEVYNLCKSARLPHSRVGKLYKFIESEIREWKNARDKVTSISVDDYVRSYLQKNKMQG